MRWNCVAVSLQKCSFQYFWGFVSCHCSLPVGLTFNMNWSFKASPKMSLSYNHASDFQYFGMERGSLNLLNSTDLLIYFAEVRLPASFQKPGARSGTGFEEGDRREPKDQWHSQSLAMSFSCGTRLSSLTHFFCWRCGQGELVLKLVQARQRWASPTWGAEWRGWWLVLIWF